MDTHHLLINAVIFLASAVLMVPIARRLGLGSVLGYLLAGIVIGPFGLRMVTDTQDIMHFAEFGVVLMLFLIGLELDPMRLWRLRKPILGLGGLQVTLTLLLSSAIAFFFLGDWKSSLVLGMCIALSSTAIALQTMEERHMLKTPTGQFGFSVLLFQDIAVIPMLAVIPLLSTSSVMNDVGNPWLNTLKMAGVMVGMILGGRFLLRHLLRFVADTGMREIFTACALLLVISISLLMELVGLSMALGTFITGVLLADSEYRHELEISIEPFKGLLLGLFFISVGMAIDFQTLWKNPLILLAALVGIIALKLVILLGLGWFFKIQNQNKWMFALILTQVGEFGFVILSFATQNQALPTHIADGMMVVVALSMAITPLLLIAFDQVQKKLQASNFMEEDTPVDEDNPVIIAGFGRFGQIVGRLLHAQGIGATILDHDAQHIEMLRRFGFKVFYGDSSRIDLLEASGAKTAKLLVLAIDDPEQILEMVHIAKQHFPQLQIVARARDRVHAQQLINLGVKHVVRETFTSGLLMAEESLKCLGMPAYSARHAVHKFKKHDDQILIESAPHHDDEQKRIAVAAASREALAHLFQSDRMELSEEGQEWG